MRYSYNLLNPLDYLRLFYGAFFDRRQLPTADKPRERITLLVQALLIVTAISLIVELNIQGNGSHLSLRRIAVNVVISGIFGWASTEEDQPKSSVIQRAMLSIEAGLMVGIVFSIAHGTLGIMAASIAATSIAIIDMKKGVAVSVVTRVSSSVVTGLLFSVMAGAFNSLFLNKTFNTNEVPNIAPLLGFMGMVLGLMPRAFLTLDRVSTIKKLGLIVIPLLFGVAFIVAGRLFIIYRVDGNTISTSGVWIEVFISIGLVISSFLFSLVADQTERISRSLSIQTDLWLGISLLAVLSVSTGYLLRFLAYSFGLTSPHPIVIAALVTLLITRLPLWPFEAMWIMGVFWWWSKDNPENGKQRLVKILNWAYFDRKMLLPLPGEAFVLCCLALWDYELVLRESIKLATESGHSVASVSALHKLACFEPLIVQRDILQIAVEKEVTSYWELLRYVGHGLPTAPAYAWEAELEVWELNSNLIFQSELNHLEAASIQLQELSISVVLDTLEQAVSKLELARQLVPAMQNIDFVLALYRKLLHGLQVDQIAAIGAYANLALPANLSPNLATFFAELDTVAAKVSGYLIATSPVTQRNFLLQANEQLEEIAQHINQRSVPFKRLLSLIVKGWRQVIATEGGELAREDATKPITNPYVIGNPVRGHLFVGREDILRELEELWAKEGQCSSVVLFGHRRMGKSSILQNLGARFGAGTIIVSFNMENYGWARNNGELLFNLALQLYDSWCDSGHNDLAEPEEVQFLNHNAYTAFNRFLTNLNRVVKGERFMIAVDEFEIIEEGINEGRFDSYLLRYWRGTFQNYPWFIMAFAGLHNLEEMRRDYWNPFYGSVKSIPVSFLSPNAARRLITQPDPNFAVDYDSDAIEQIINLTNGQPYLVQLICHTLVTRFNRQTFEEGIERERRFTVEDVEAVINAPEFYRDGNAYFNGVWVQAETSEPTGQVDILKALSRNRLSLNAIADKTVFSLEQVQAALETLKRHDVIEQRDEYYVYTVELMRRWVERREEQ